MKMFLVLSLGLISIFLNAQSINLKSGWQLKGTEVGFNDMNSFKKDCIKTVWRYNDIEKKWEAFSPKEAIQEKIKNSMFVSKLDKINPNDGFWIFADNNCTIESNSTTHDMNLSRGLVAWYQFEGNANDSSRNGNDGVEHGGISYVDGIIGKAAKFDGVDDYVDINKISVSKYNNFYISAWIKINNFTTCNASYNDKMTIFYSRNDGYPETALSININNQQMVIRREGFGNLPTYKVLKGKWTNIGYLLQNNSISLYINGEKISTTTGNSSSNTDSANKNIPFWIGKTNVWWGEGYCFNGSIDDLRIYNRALNEEEIKALYNMGKK